VTDVEGAFGSCFGSYIDSKAARQDVELGGYGQKVHVFNFVQHVTSVDFKF
jgi:hypothetical protein